VLADLRVRLSSTRWPDQVQDAGWEQGTERETLRSLVAHWADGFDWRAYERDLNALPQFKADVRGLGIHFVHQRAARRPGLPIILVNGWPSNRRSTGARISAPGPDHSRRPSACTSPGGRARSKASTRTTSFSRPSLRASATR
jgi:hypothetical protein